LVLDKGRHGMYPLVEIDGQELGEKSILVMGMFHHDAGLAFGLTDT
jgi:hypothetical protein